MLYGYAIAPSFSLSLFFSRLPPEKSIDVGNASNWENIHAHMTMKRRHIQNVHRIVKTSKAKKVIGYPLFSPLSNGQMPSIKSIVIAIIQAKQLSRSI